MSSPASPREQEQRGRARRMAVGLVAVAMLIYVAFIASGVLSAQGSVPGAG
ncbi:MAG: hypothetical protein AAGA23_09005 [Pseudomonadota bacterium]